MYNKYKSKKYFRYLKKYVGTYRVVAEYDKSTNDFPRDADGEIDCDFEDFYIPCKKGIIKHAYCDTLYWYTDKIKTGHNVYSELSNRDDFVIDDYEETSCEMIIYFNSKYIDIINEVVTLRTLGKSVQPFSVKNLPKVPYEIPKFDMEKLNKLFINISHQDKLIFMNKAIHKFINKHYKSNADFNTQRKKNMLKPMQYIHSLGKWDKYIEIVKEIIKENNE